MKTLKYLVVIAVIAVGFSSCVVDRERPYHHHRYHEHGYGRY